MLNCYVLLAPFFPALLFSLESHSEKRQQLTQAVLNPKVAAKSSGLLSDSVNHVVIPSMLLDQRIYEGPTSQQYQILNKGIWRWPLGSTPDKGGNTVLIGHRFTYTDPRGVFYYLNKVSIGDVIGVFWNDKEYRYNVVNIEEVPPNDTTIERSTTQAELTLFTCTPLFLPKDRLVIVADLETRQ